MAITLPSSASAEHRAIAPPQSQTVPRLPVGATSSMMWERIHGMARSMTVPTNLSVRSAMPPEAARVRKRASTGAAALRLRFAYSL